jgi:hypothetical protein
MTRQRIAFTAIGAHFLASFTFFSAMSTAMVPPKEGRIEDEEALSLYEDQEKQIPDYLLLKL